MSNEEVSNLPMTLKEKSSGKIFKSDGLFHTITADWNYDGDVYTDTIMRVYELNGNSYRNLHTSEFFNEFDEL